METGKDKQTRLVGPPDARKRACPVRGALDGNLMPQGSKALSFDSMTLQEACGARAQEVVKVRLSAQPAADRSAQRLIQRRRWAAPAAGWAARRHPERWGRPPNTPRWGALRVRWGALLALQPGTASAWLRRAPIPELCPPPTRRRHRPRLQPRKACGFRALRAAPALPLPPGAPRDQSTPPGADRERSPSAPSCWQGLRKEPAEKTPAGSPCQRALRGSGGGVGSGGMSGRSCLTRGMLGARGLRAAVALPLVAARLPRGRELQACPSLARQAHLRAGRRGARAAARQPCRRCAPPRA